jgi:thiol:disulfide interchange protein
MMKAITWLAAVTLGVAAVSSTAFANTLEGWSTDVEAAVAQAKKEKKAVLVEFTGSDWCPPCIMMRKNVFSKKEFVDAASKDYVLVEVDLPKKDKELAAKNQIVAEKYKIEGFPTVVLLNPEGKEFTRFFAAEYPKMEDFLAHLKTSLEKQNLD